jgi:hypothetical protein
MNGLISKISEMGRYITFDLADNGFLEMIQQI